MAKVRLSSPYTTTDPENDLTVSSGSVTATGYNDSNGAMVRRNYGLRFTADASWTDVIQLNLSALTGGDTIIHHYAAHDGPPGNGNGIGLTWFGVSPSQGLYLHEYYGGGSSIGLSTPIILLTGTDYWLVFEHDASAFPILTLRLSVYSDEALTTQVGSTQTLNRNAATDFDTHYAFLSRSTAETGLASFEVGPFDLGQVGLPDNPDLIPNYVQACLDALTAAGEGNPRQALRERHPNGENLISVSRINTLAALPRYHGAWVKQILDTIAAYG